VHHRQPLSPSAAKVPQPAQLHDEAGDQLL
jgi:hypothetical protein